MPGLRHMQVFGEEQPVLQERSGTGVCHVAFSQSECFAEVSDSVPVLEISIILPRTPGGQEPGVPCPAYSLDLREAPSSE